MSEPAAPSDSPVGALIGSAASGSVESPRRERETVATPGSSAMPAWEREELPAPPVFRGQSWSYLLGPGLVMGASAIGGGEWLTGPLVTAKYGGALLWLATLSIFFQVIYNIEISRYTLYTGEPIFTGKFRVLPHPLFWVGLYLILDFGSFLPYLASNAAIPLAAMYLGRIPSGLQDAWLLKPLACGLFVAVVFPLSIGGKVYDSLKAVMTFKLIYVIIFLMFLAVCYSTPATWWEIGSGFLKFGNYPIAPNAEGQITENFFLALWSGRPLTPIDWSMLGILASMAAISGNGGLTNTPISSYTRDQGWGMGKHVGAIPSIVGGHAIELSHTGMVFDVTPESLPRWRGWMKHVTREQLWVWLPACFFGLALPSMLSVQFIQRGTVPNDKWQAAAMTADGVATAVGGVIAEGASASPLYNIFWMLTLFCGFLILSTSLAGTSDGVLRRWVDLIWTGVPWFKQWDPRHVGRLYFAVLLVYVAIGLTMLIWLPGDKLLTIATGMLYNAALGFSCWHTLAVNTLLVPKPLRPGWGPRVCLVLGGVFFSAMAVMSMVASIPDLQKEWQALFPPAASAQP